MLRMYSHGIVGHFGKKTHKYILFLICPDLLLSLAAIQAPVCLEWCSFLNRCVWKPCLRTRLQDPRAVQWAGPAYFTSCPATTLPCSSPSPGMAGTTVRMKGQDGKLYLKHCACMSTFIMNRIIKHISHLKMVSLTEKAGFHTPTPSLIPTTSTTRGAGQCTGKTLGHSGNTSYGLSMANVSPVFFPLQLPLTIQGQQWQCWPTWQAGVRRPACLDPRVGRGTFPPSPEGEHLPPAPVQHGRQPQDQPEAQWSHSGDGGVDGAHPPALSVHANAGGNNA